MIKLFATDLDGTLLVDQHIPKENADALKELQRRGVQIAFVSGRVTASMRYLAHEVGLEVPVIGTNGAIARDAQGHVDYEQPLSAAAWRKLIEIGDAMDLYYHFYDADTFYAKTLYESRFRHLIVREHHGIEYQCNIHIQNDLENLFAKETIHPLKIQYTADESQRDELTKRLSEIPGVYITRSGTKLVEVMDSTVNKWEALRRYAGHHGVAPEEIATAGDFENDLPMIRNAGFGIAIGDALDVVKESAKYVTSAHDAFGIRDAIQHMIDAGMVPEANRD